MFSPSTFQLDLTFLTNGKRDNREFGFGDLMCHSCFSKACILAVYVALCGGEKGTLIYDSCCVGSAISLKKMFVLNAISLRFFWIKLNEMQKCKSLIDDKV